MKIKLCKLIGCVPVDINTDEATAVCGRCGKQLNVEYDMSYGDTIVTGLAENKEDSYEPLPKNPQGEEIDSFAPETIRAAIKDLDRKMGWAIGLGVIEKITRLIELNNRETWAVTNRKFPKLCNPIPTKLESWLRKWFMDGR
jgi:hypothetical protein